MNASGPSRTALRVALRRAAHQLVDAEPLVLPDPFAVRIVGKAYGPELRRTPSALRKPHSASLRAWMVARARLAEDALATALQHAAAGPAKALRGADVDVDPDSIQAGPHPAAQYLVLGAGLDTFALRNPHPGVRVFEVDHPATQAWKREMLAEAGLELPAAAELVAVDFERDSLRERLQDAGFDFSALTVAAWLGVVPYLTEQAFRTTLAMLGSFRAGSLVVFDYAQPRHTLGPVERLMLDSLASRVAQAGEPFRLFRTPGAMQQELCSAGFRVLEDVGAAELNARFFTGRSDGLCLRGGAGRLVTAEAVRCGLGESDAGMDGTKAAGADALF